MEVPPIAEMKANSAEVRKEALLIPIGCVKDTAVSSIIGLPELTEHDPSVTLDEVMEYAPHAMVKAPEGLSLSQPLQGECWQAAVRAVH